MPDSAQFPQGILGEGEVRPLARLTRVELEDRDLTTVVL